MFRKWWPLLLCSVLAADPPLEGYADYAAHSARVAALEANEAVRVSSLGRTLGGREIHLLSIGGAEPDARPALCVVGNVYAPHLVGSELALRMAEQLAARAAEEPAVRALLREFTVYVVPRPSPDASEAFFAALSQGRSGNERATDDDRDGRLDEDPAEDLDGDGAITWLRVEDPAGKWMEHPADSSILIEAVRSDDERGRWSLYSEGVDNDKDGAFNEDGPGGVDFNANLTWNYPFFAPGAGPHQVSERETRALLDWLFSRPNIAMVLSFGPDDNLQHPWKPDGRKEGERILEVILRDDAPHADFVAEKARALLGEGAPGPGSGAGSFAKWAYFHYGRWSFASRGWWVPSVEPDSTEIETDEKRGEDVLNFKRYLRAEGLDGWAPWTPVEHPDFPGQRVEAGGERPYFRLNPRADTLDTLAAKHLELALNLEELRPRLALELSAEDLGGGLYELTLTARNDGYLPTLPAIGERSREGYPLMAGLTLPAGVALVDGSPRRRVGRLAGNGGERSLRWLLRAAPGAELQATVESPSVGSADASLVLR